MIAVNFQKSQDGLIPAIVQDVTTNKILMLGYMNDAALSQTQQTGLVTFFSRSKKRLWTKGETSGNFLEVKEIRNDCDNDTLLIKVTPRGPACHTGADTCFREDNIPVSFLTSLEQIITDRKNNPEEQSYVAQLFSKGINKIAQKVGEEAVELIIEAKDTDDELFKNEAADLLFHYMILLVAKGYTLKDITQILQDRHRKQQ